MASDVTQTRTAESVLDVERLARALDNGLQLGQPWTSEASYDDFLLACATAIATEYAALARLSESES